MPILSEKRKVGQMTREHMVSCKGERTGRGFEYSHPVGIQRVTIEDFNNRDNPKVIVRDKDNIVRLWEFLGAVCKEEGWIPS